MCSGPGPHIPADGILGTTDAEVIKPVLCPSIACQAANVAAGAAAVTAQANTTTLQTQLALRLGQLETFIAANPNGAVLNAAQSLVLAKMLVQLARLLSGNVSTIGQGG